jgi:outer membrane cobalamin receptor
MWIEVVRGASSSLFGSYAMGGVVDIISRIPAARETAIVGRGGWNEYSLMARAVATGIPLHMGSLGWWNLAGTTVVCLSQRIRGRSPATSSLDPSKGRH